MNVAEDRDTAEQSHGAYPLFPGLRKQAEVQPVRRIHKRRNIGQMHE